MDHSRYRLILRTVLSRQTLISLVGSNDAVVRLGLHQQHVELNEALKILVVDMEIRTAIGEERKTDSDFIELHYIELHASQLGTDYDSSLKVHRPYLWSIDVAHTNKSADGRIYKKSTRIIHYAVSGDGSHVATLSALDKILYLDVWDVASKSSALTNAAQNNTPQPPLHPWRCAQKQLQLEMAILPSLVISPVTVSVSWNASMITIIAANTKHLKNTFQVFRHNGNLCLVPGKKHVSPPAHSLIYTEIDQLCEQLKGACGFGKFHLTASDNQDPKNELTSNGPNYKVNYRRLIGGLRGKYFAWRDNKDTISICNLESGLLVSRIPNGQNAHFSSDGSMVAISHPDATITTRWINSNACISSKDACRTSPAHVLGGTRVLVIQMAPDERYGRGQIGLILDAMSMDIICRVSIPLLAFEQQQILTDPDGSCLYSQLGSKVNLIQIENATLQPHLQAADKCGYQCFDNLTYITAMATYATDNEAIVTMASGLTFTARFETLRASSMAPGVEHRPLVISISDGNSRFQEALRVPSVPIGDISVEWLAYKVAFNIERQEMMVYNDIFIMVWGLPETLDGEFTLLLGWWIQFSTFQTKNGLDWLWSGLSRCPHQRYYATTNNMDDYGEYVMVDAVQLDTDDPFSQKNVIQFLDGVLVLVEIFHSGDEQFKDAILQYVGRHLNSYPDPNDLVDNVLGRICRNVNQENYSYYTEFLRALFDSHYGNWVPRPEYNSKTNPIWMLLISAETFPRAMNLAQVLIDYCVRKANKERNWYFVTPILGPLHDLVDRKHLYAQIVRKTLRNLAFIPVMDRSYVIDHHIIAHPPELRWGFWQSNQTPLHKCKDPILQLDYNPTPTEHNLQTDNFTRDMFVASFDLLWREPESSASVKEVNSQASDSLMSIILHAIWLNCKIKSRTTVECHDFELELLDNPAIAALVEYKW
ncbi:hypothetical protein BGZ51_001174 [Haplosporangium sp. Z 767]|nr:hypothetical protein BGZ51_001174 [Haplosporangium sp. Z 767]